MKKMIIAALVAVASIGGATAAVDAGVDRASCYASLEGYGAYSKCRYMSQNNLRQQVVLSCVNPYTGYAVIRRGPWVDGGRLSSTACVSPYTREAGVTWKAA